MPLTQDCFSIILPVHNQANHIDHVVKSYTGALTEAGLKFELVLVNNASRDDSAEKCSQLARDHAEIIAINTSKSGWGNAVNTGLKAASGNILCYTNSARTSPEVLVKALQHALENPQTVVKATRQSWDNWKRRLGSAIYNLECRVLFGLPVWDVNGTPKVFPRSFDKLLNLKRDDDLIDAEFNAVCKIVGYPILELPVQSIKRHGGKSTTNYNSAWKMYLGALDLWREMILQKQ